VDLTASSLSGELPRPFIAACMVSLAVHAGVAGWYALDDDTTPVQLPRPTLHVKVRALRERASIAPTAKRAHTVVRQPSPRREPPPVTTPSPSPIEAASHSAETHEKPHEPEQPAKSEKTEPVMETQPMPPPVQAAAAAMDKQPAYSPPSCSSASLNNPKPDYPRIALRRGIEGLVLLHVEVDEQGQPIEIHVKKSAGFKPLDIAALKAVRRWRFLPAQRNGVTVRASVEVPIRFRLENADHSDS